MAVEIVKYLWITIQVLIGYNLVFPIVIYLLSLIKKTAPIVGRGNIAKADYGIIVTAYEQTGQLNAVVRSLLNLNYSHYIIYIVADCCDVSGLNFDDNRVVVLRPTEALQSNVKSHFYAINHFVRNHDRLTIIDSDNLVEPGYLNEINKYFDKGYHAVQGVRMPKNLNTTYACLDAARDIYYHFYDGKILFNVGSSATLAGSGMAFTTGLYVNCMQAHANLSGAGFDKVLQAEIVKRNCRIAFAEKALVYDEKTTHPQQLVSQRSRWINTWFRYFKYGFTIMKLGIVNRSLNQFLFGWVLLRPPLFIFLLLSAICAIVNLLINPIYSLIWIPSFMLFIIGFGIALQHSNTDRQILRSLKNIPLFIYYQVAATFKLRYQKGNIATRHATNIDHNI